MVVRMTAYLCYGIYLLTLACIWKSTSAYVVGGAVMPHGALILDPRNFNGSDNSTEPLLALHYGAIDTARFIQSLEPEIILLVTPHGLALPEQFLLYNNPGAVGSVSIDAWLPCSFEPCTYNASAIIDIDLTRQLEAALTARGCNLTSISGFGPPAAGTLPLPLAWGEVVPLYFISRAYGDNFTLAATIAVTSESVVDSRKQLVRSNRDRLRQRRLAAFASGVESGSKQTYHIRSKSAGKATRIVDPFYGGPKSLTQFANPKHSNDAHPGFAGAVKASDLPKILILSMPSRRYGHSVAMVPELLALGKALFGQLDSLDQRIAVVVSGDLAHTWDPAGPYGFSDEAARFDAAVQQWVRDLDRNALVKTAANSVEEAKSCGFPGMVLLQGLMDGIKPDDMHSVLLQYCHPSYYGMMCAVFDFQGDA